MATELDPELIAKVNYEMERFGRLTAETAEELSFARTGVTNFAAKLAAATGAVTSLADAFVSYNKAVYSGEQGAKAFSQSTRDMADAAKYAAAGLALLIPGGLVVKALVAGLGLLAAKFIESSAIIGEQTDQIFTAFSGMAKAGAAGAGGMQGAFESMQKLGMGTERAADYIRLMGENANDFAMMGGTVAVGRKIFEQTYRNMQQFSTDLTVLGVPPKEQQEAVAAYLRQQRLLTIGTKSQMDTSSSAVKRYIEETDQLARITGANREEQQKLLDKAMGEEIFASFIDELQSQGEEGKKRAETIRANNVLAEKLLGPELARGIRDNLSGFIGVSDASKKAFMASNGAVAEYADTMRNTTMTQQQGTVLFGKFAGTVADTYENQVKGLAQMGVAESVYGKISELRRAGLLTEQSMNQALKEAEKEALDQKNDPTTKNYAQVLKQQQEDQMAQQKLVNAGMDTYVAGMLSAATANNKLVAAAEGAAMALGLIAGGKERALVKNTTQTVGSTTGLATAEQALKEATTKEQTEQAENDIKFHKNKLQTLAKEKQVLEEEQRNHVARQHLIKEAQADLKTKEARLAKLNETATGVAAATGGQFGGTAQHKEAAEAHRLAKNYLKHGTAGNTANVKKLRETGFGSPPKDDKAEAPATAAPATAAPSTSNLSGASLDGVNDNIKNALLKAADEYKSVTGKTLQINSALRTKEDQLRLYNETIRLNTPGFGPSGMPVAKPGTSSHELGNAVDIQNYRDPAAIEALKRQGLMQTVPKDPVHFTMPKVGAEEGGILKGPASGYNARLHGTEAVIPMNNNSGDFVKMFKTMAEMMTKQADSMDELIRETRNSNDIQSKMLQVARS